MSNKSIINRILNFDILLALISGPIVSTLVMLIPLGVLVGLFEVIDPAFVAYEYVPEEILFIPWILGVIFISYVNTRATYLLNNLESASTSYIIETGLFYTPPEDRFELDEFPGKTICNEFKSFMIKILPGASCSMPSHKDYGWSFTINNDINSMIEITFSFIGIDELNPHIEKYEVTIDFSPPLNPFHRVSFSPDVSTYEKVLDALKAFLSTNGIDIRQE